MGACLSKICPFCLKQSSDLMTDSGSEASQTRSTDSFVTIAPAQSKQTTLQPLLQYEPNRSQSLTQISSQDLPYTIAQKDRAYKQLRKHRPNSIEKYTNETIVTQCLSKSGQKIKTDTRVKNDRSAEYPYNCIGLLYQKRKKGSNNLMVGTGFVISSHLVLTAAHNVFNKKQGIKQGLTFYPGIHGQRQYAEKRQVVQVWVNQEYKKTSDKRFDFALIKLNIGINRDRYIMIGQDYPKANKAEIYGYPIDKIQKEEGVYQQFGAQGLVKEISNDLIFYVIDTMHGQSGSPIVVQLVKGLYFAIGIHIRYDPDRKLNCGIQLTNSKVQTIKDWMSSMMIEDKCIIINCQTIAQLPCYNGPLTMIKPQQKIVRHLQQLKTETETHSLKRLFIQLAKMYRVLANCQESLYYLSRASNISSSSESSTACVWNQKGMVYYLKQDYQRSTEAYENAYKIYKQLKKYRDMAATLTNIGNNYIKLQRYDDAAQKILQAIAINQDLTKDKQGELANSYSSYACVLLKANRLEEAEDFLTKALELKKTSTIKCYQEQIHLYYYNLAGCHYKMKKFQQSFNEYSTTINVMIKLSLTDHKNFKKSMKRLNEIITESMKSKTAKEVLIKMCKIIDPIKDYDKELRQKMKILKQEIQNI